MGRQTEVVLVVGAGIPPSRAPRRCPGDRLEPPGPHPPGAHARSKYKNDRTIELQNTVELQDYELMSWTMYN